MKQGMLLALLCLAACTDAQVEQGVGDVNAALSRARAACEVARVVRQAEPAAVGTLGPAVDAVCAAVNGGVGQ